MIKYSFVVEDNFCMELEVGVNINGLFFFCLKMSFGLGRMFGIIFFGMDW